MATDIGTGSTVTFGTSAYTALIKDISWDGIQRKSVETSYLGTTTAHTFMPGDLYDPGSLKLEVLYDPGTIKPPLNGAVETVTVTFPDANTAAASGFITAWSIKVPLEDVMTATVEVKFTGAITITT